jgi:Protein of unknown function (DUF1702)
MPTIRGALRGLVLSPALTEVTFATRGFPVLPSAAMEQLEAVPQVVICGFEWGIEARNQWEVERRLSMVEPGLRGFAYEGVTMAFTVLDAAGAALADLSAQAAVALADDTSPNGSGPGDLPAYEVWRRNIRGRLAAR